jgi:AcrR family transcriptional regulator
MNSSTSARRRYPQAQRREQLLDVSERLFVDRGYAAVTMEDIARMAAVTRPVVYNHFETKEGVYIACVERARRQYEEELLGAIDVDDHPKTQLTRGAEVFFGMLQRDPGRWMLLFGSSSVLPGTHTAELAALRFATIDAVAALLRRAAPDAPKLRIEAVAHAVSGVGERLGHWWLTKPSMRRGEVVEHFTEIIWTGLSPYIENRG